MAETPDALLLALDQVTDPHNLGACIRTAAAMGVQAVIVPRDRSASLTPTARKVAAGGAEKVKFIQVTNLARTLAHLKDTTHVRVIGTMLDESALPIQNVIFLVQLSLLWVQKTQVYAQLLRHSVIIKFISRCLGIYRA